MPTQQAQEALMEAMKGLYLSEKHSDFKIKCQDDVYPVHKAIICPRSDFFDASTRFGKEAEEGQVNLPEDEPEIVELMIQYFYELDYQISGTADAHPVSIRYQPGPSIKDASKWHRDFANGLAGLNKEGMAKAVKIFERHFPDQEMSSQGYVLEWRDYHVGLPCVKELAMLIHGREYSKGTPWKPIAFQNAPIIHAKMYAIADKYNVLGLKELAIDKFIAASDDHFTNMGFYEALDIVFTSTPDQDPGLRNVVVEYVYNDIEVYGLQPRADDKLKSVPDLAYHVIKRHFIPKGWGVERRS